MHQTSESAYFSAPGQRKAAWTAGKGSGLKAHRSQARTAAMQSSQLSCDAQTINRADFRDVIQDAETDICPSPRAPNFDITAATKGLKGPGASNRVQSAAANLIRNNYDE
jgi:hypothetical protein